MTSLSNQTRACGDCSATTSMYAKADSYSPNLHWPPVPSAYFHSTVWLLMANLRCLARRSSGEPGSASIRGSLPTRCDILRRPTAGPEGNPSLVGPAPPFVRRATGGRDPRPGNDAGTVSNAHAERPRAAHRHADAGSALS